MTLTQRNKTVYQGVDDNLLFVITDNSTPPVPRDITYATFTFTAYHNATGDVLQKTLGNGLVFGTVRSGQVGVLFTAAEMTIPALTYTYQLFMTITVGGITATTLEATGYLTVEPGRILEEVTP